MSDSDALATYRDKRDFRRTGEPRGKRARGGGKRALFVIQKHAASQLHYDLRLEIDGTLKSWAVPKGPSTDPREKRLAIQTEDHPLGYADFEGSIPTDQYGGGAVLVWDAGSYRNLKVDEHGEPQTSMAAAHADGHLTFWLEGKKLRGGYALTRSDGDQAQWLLVKMEDAAADARRNPVSTEPKSVLSARTLGQIATQEGGDEGS